MSNTKIAVVGAGITGLTAASVFNKRGFEADVFEQHGYAGGSIKTVQQEGWLLEYGPNTLLLKDQKIADFLKETGLWEERITANPESSNRFIVKNGELVPLPSSILDAVTTPLFSSRGKLECLKEPFIAKTDNRNETIAEFVKRRLGKEILDYALNPFIAGIYANKPEKLSLRHTFPAIYELEQQYGSLIWGAFAGRKERKKKGQTERDLISFRGGLQQVVEALISQIGPVFYNHEVQRIQKNEGQWFLTSRFGNHGPYDKVLLNVPLYKWTEKLLPIQKNELEEIRQVEYPPLSVFHLGFKKADIQHPMDGFGFLVPAKENANLLGALFSSTLFPGRAPADCHLLTVFAGGDRQPELAQQESNTLLKIVLEELTPLIGLKGEPVFKEHVFWPHSIPAYHVGYERVLSVFQSLEERNPGLHIAGNFRNGVSVPDCIKNGLILSEQILSGESDE